MRGGWPEGRSGWSDLLLIGSPDHSAILCVEGVVDDAVHGCVRVDGINVLSATPIALIGVMPASTGLVSMA